MIPIRRGREPAQLALVRSREQAKLQSIAGMRHPTGDDITGYQCVAKDLWRGQYYKCCYCELKLPVAYNDVEHYRPKARADRVPGSSETHGYWWLAHSWENLLFACSTCNRSQKNDRFPLKNGSVVLQPLQTPPGQELPLLLDPAAAINPVVHIQFEYRTLLGFPGPKQWFAQPRNGSKLGEMTIEVCGLNDAGLVELRKDHVARVVMEKVSDLEDGLRRGDTAQVQRVFTNARGLLDPGNAFVALTYDALCQLIPRSKLSPLGLGWPEPKEVGMPTRRHAATR